MLCLAVKEDEKPDGLSRGDEAYISDARSQKAGNACSKEFLVSDLVHSMWRSADRDLQELLEFRCVRPLRTVHGLLAERGGLALLADGLMERATAEIVAGDRPRAEVQRDIKQKERAREALVRKHRSTQLSEVCAQTRICHTKHV